jgi:tetratricopeptide (TPR) repeat protein
LKLCEQAIQLAPTKPRAYEEKGDILARLKRYDDALPAYRKAVQLDPQKTSVYEKVGDILSVLERFAEAVKAYDHIIQLRPDGVGAYCSKVRALEKLKHYDKALAACNKGLQHSPQNLSLISARAGVLKKLMRYEEANAEYDRIKRIDPRSLYVLSSILGKVDLAEVTAAKARLEAASKEISDEAIEAEIRLMHQEKRAAELKAALRASPLFGPICLLMQERQEWSGTPKQFKELICARFPDEFASWYRAPQKYVGEVKKIAPELRVEGITAGVPPETTLVTLARTVMEGEQQYRPDEANPGPTHESK